MSKYDEGFNHGLLYGVASVIAVVALFAFKYIMGE